MEEQGVRNVGLVLACDLTPEGELGWHTIKRLEAGVQWQKKTGGLLVVAAMASPYHLNQSRSIAALMADWLMLQGISLVKIVVASTFNTRGELWAMVTVPAASYTIITAWWHVPRVRLIVWQMFGWRFMRRTHFVSAWSDRPSLKQLVLELPKLIHIVLPASWRGGAQRLWEKYFGRSAW